MKCKHFWFAVTKEYLEKQDVNVLNVLCSYRTIKKWAYVLHDRDKYTALDEMKNPEHKAGTEKPAHYHIYCNFGKQSIDHEYFASLFKVSPDSIRRIETTAANCLLYFVHGTADAIAEGKYQYTWSEVQHSSNWSPQTQAEQVRYIGHFERFSYKEQIDKVHEIKDVNERVKIQKLLDDAYKTELQYRMTFIDRYVQVMFVTGDTASGKTTFARQFIEKLNYYDIVPKDYWRTPPDDTERPFRALDYGISGSSNDPLEMYKGQEAYILDDLRDESMKFSDLLKFLDNHTNSAVKSRFCNKCFFGSLLIITSIVPLSKWYKFGDNKVSGENLRQFYRRINTYVEVDQDEIRLYPKINDYGEPCGEVTLMPNRTSEYYKNKPKRISLCDVAKKAFMTDEQHYESSLDKAFSEAKPIDGVQNSMFAENVKYVDEEPPEKKGRGGI